MKQFYRKSSPTVRGSGERNGEQKRTKVSFGRTMMQALELLQLAKSWRKGTSRDEAILNSEEIKPAVIELCLSEGVRYQSDSQKKIRNF